MSKQDLETRLLVRDSNVEKLTVIVVYVGSCGKYRSRKGPGETVFHFPYRRETGVPESRPQGVCGRITGFRFRTDTFFIEDSR